MNDYDDYALVSEGRQGWLSTGQVTWPNPPGPGVPQTGTAVARSSQATTFSHAAGRTSRFASPGLGAELAETVRLERAKGSLPLVHSRGGRWRGKGDRAGRLTLAQRGRRVDGAKDASPLRRSGALGFAVGDRAIQTRDNDHRVLALAASGAPRLDAATVGVHRTAGCQPRKTEDVFLETGRPGQEATTLTAPDVCRQTPARSAPVTRTPPPGRVRRRRSPMKGRR